MKREEALQLLYGYNKKLHVLGAISALTDWDRATGGPKGGLEVKQEIFGFLSEEEYQTLTSERFGNMLDALKEEELSPKDKRLYLLTKRQAEDVRRIPKEEYIAYSKFSAEAQEVWEKAKEEDNYPLFAPYLEKVVEYQKKFAGYRQKEGQALYDVLLDDYEEGFSMKDYDAFFEYLKKELVPLIDKIQREGKKTAPLKEAIFPIAAQEEVSKKILQCIGFDFERGMLKKSAHPFTTGMDNKDVRLTTRYQEEDLAMSLFSTLHEGGHAIYEQQVSDEFRFTKLGQGASSGVHESQSRTFENEYGKSRAFMGYYLPLLQDYFQALRNVEEEAFYKMYNQAVPSAIRIEADELTYPLHIIIRYEMEKEMMTEEIDFSTLNQKWKEKYKEYLGIDIETDREGILQDVHWGAGLIGYFPTYALGSAYGAQFVHTMKEDLDLDELLKKGEFGPILTWHREQIHQKGSLYSPKELLKQVTKESLNPKYYADYLKEKFAEIYEIEFCE